MRSNKIQDDSDWEIYYTCVSFRRTPEQQKYLSISRLIMRHHEKFVEQYATSWIQTLFYNNNEIAIDCDFKVVNATGT